MEQVYRRQSTQPSRHKTARKRFGGEKYGLQNYKRTVIEQSAFCILLFVAALVIKMYPASSMDFAKNSIQFILTEQTDWAMMLENTKDFFMQKVLQKPSEQEELDPLANLTAPVAGEINSPFGMRIDPMDGEEKFHYGVDFLGNSGDKIQCAADGLAQEIGFSEEYGNYILVKHSETIASFYAHCDKILPVEGDSIKAGQVIATMGTSGNVKQPCLHFEIREGDTSLDPAVFLKSAE